MQVLLSPHEMEKESIFRNGSRQSIGLDYYAYCQPKNILK